MSSGEKKVPPPTKPKPKPKPTVPPPTKPKPTRPKPDAAMAIDQSEGTSAAHSSYSSPPDHQDPTLDFDLDAVTRQQILDNSALLNRASLSQSRGLQNRRLPSNVAGKVPADYASRRRTRMYTGMSSGDELDDDGNTDEVSHELTAEERRQMVKKMLEKQQR